MIEAPISGTVPAVLYIFVQPTRPPGTKLVKRGVVEAARNLGVKVPIVLCLEGTNVEEGQKVLQESGLNFLVAKGMQDAAAKAVAATNN